MSPHGMVEESSGEAPHSKRAESMGNKVPVFYAEVTKGPRKVVCVSVWLQFGNVNSFNKMQVINCCLVER